MITAIVTDKMLTQIHIMASSDTRSGDNITAMIVRELMAYRRGTRLHADGTTTPMVEAVPGQVAVDEADLRAQCYQLAYWKQCTHCPPNTDCSKSECSHVRAEEVALLAHFGLSAPEVPK